jgi:hypothetical protein
MATWKKVIADGSSLSDIGTPASDDKILIQDTSDSNVVKYVDWADVGGGGDVVSDTTPQLGGDLDLNSNNITGTGDINITGNILASATISSIGNISTLANASVTGTLSVTGNTNLSTVNVSTKLTTPAIDFSGLGGTSTVGISTVGGGSPSDLEIQSNGNVTVVLDDDDNESDQYFRVESGDGTLIWQVNESGVTSGLLTTATPTLTGAASSYAQGASVSGISVSNHVAGRAYEAAIYNSSGVEQTSNPVTVDSSGNITFTAPSTTATGYELRVAAADVGKFKSLQATATFEVTPTRTFTYWRLRAVDSGGNDSSNKCAWVDISFWTGASGTGTAYPTTAATSNTSISGVTISAGQRYSSSYEEWRAFDSGTGQNAGSMWWTLGGNATNNWIQLQFSTAQTFSSATIEVYDSFNDATHFQIEGSNTGNFTGEEVVFGLTAMSEGSGATTSTVNF